MLLDLHRALASATVMANMVSNCQTNSTKTPSPSNNFAAAKQTVPLRFAEKINKAIDSTAEPLREKLEALIAALQSKEKEKRDRALSGLQKFKKAAIPFLLRDLADKEYNTRQAAHDALASLKGEAIEGLLSAVKSSNLEVRVRAGVLLNQIRQAANIYLMKDEQGRLRRIFDPKTGALVLSVDYREDGVLEDLQIRSVSFRLQAEGKYTRDDLPAMSWDSVVVSNNGTVRFTLGNEAIEWDPDRTTRFYRDGSLKGGIRNDGSPLHVVKH
jgi:hypothetical protein